MHIIERKKFCWLIESDLRITSAINFKSWHLKRLFKSYRLLGFSTVQANLRNGRRVSAAKAFLAPIRNSRRNLRILPYSRVTKLLIDPETRRTMGVRFTAGNGKSYVARAKREVLLCAGTLNSPQLLMLSGVGPRQHLEDLGIEVLEDLPVGMNLQDHVSMAALTFMVNDSVTIVETRLAMNPMNTLDYLLMGRGPFTVPGGAEALAFIDTKSRELFYSFFIFIYFQFFFFFSKWPSPYTYSANLLSVLILLQIMFPRTHAKTLREEFLIFNENFLKVWCVKHISNFTHLDSIMYLIVIVQSLSERTVILFFNLHLHKFKSKV